MSTTAEGTVVRAPAAELDLVTAPLLRVLLSAAHRPGATVVLDLQLVTFIDSSALAVVLAADRRLQREDGELVLVNVHPNVLRVLRICGLADRLVHRLERAADRPPAAAGRVPRLCRQRRLRAARRR